MKSVLNEAFKIIQFLDNSGIEYECGESYNFLTISIPSLGYELDLHKDGGDGDKELEILKEFCREKIESLGFESFVNWSAYGVIRFENDDSLSIQLGQLESWINALNFIKLAYSRLNANYSSEYDSRIELHTPHNEIHIYRDYCVIEGKDKKYTFDQLDDILEDIKDRGEVYVSIRGCEMKHIGFDTEEEIREIIKEALDKAGFKLL